MVTKRKRKQRVTDPLVHQKLQERAQDVKSRREGTIKAVRENMERRMKDRKALTVWPTEQKKLTKSLCQRMMAEIREEMKSVFEAGILNARADNVLKEKVKFEVKTSKLKIDKSSYKLRKNVHLVGWGKEALVLGVTFEKLIGDHLKKGWLVVPRGSISAMWNDPIKLPKLDTRITFLEAGSNGLPDKSAFEAGRKIADYCKKLKKRDILFVVLSSGTKDLLCFPRDPVTFQEKLGLISELTRKNANRKEIDFVRKKLSALRGGGLARLAHPAKVVTLIMSDIPGNPVGLIAGGPTFDEESELEMKYSALKILEKYHLERELPEPLLKAITSGFENPAIVGKKENRGNVDFHIVGSLSDAIAGMEEKTFCCGFVPIAFPLYPQNRAWKIAKEYVKMTSLMILAIEGKITKLEMFDHMKYNRVIPLPEGLVRDIFPNKEKMALGLYLLFGGRSLVKTSGECGGIGGPNQELALYFSLHWFLKTEEFPLFKRYVVWFLGGSTSGVDGNSSVAGAYGYGDLATGVYKKYLELTKTKRSDGNDEKMGNPERRLEVLAKELEKLEKILPDRVLKNHDTYNMFMSVNYGAELLKVETEGGDTNTNVGDLHLIRIARFSCACTGNGSWNDQEGASSTNTNYPANNSKRLKLDMGSLSRKS